MPRYPDYSARVDKILHGSFNAFRKKLNHHKKQGSLVPLHIGDTYLLPPKAARSIEETGFMESAENHIYGPILGYGWLREALGARVADFYGLNYGAGDIFVGAGSTGCLSVAAQSLFDFGDEVIVLTPSWPLIFGVLIGVGAVPIQLPVSKSGWPDEDPAEFLERLEGAITDKTAAIYFSNPNNPVGYCHSRRWLEAIAETARKNNLWVFSDEAYADLTFTSQKHIPFLSLPDVKEFGLAFYTFSKSYAMAAHRVGYCLHPRSVKAQLSKMMTHTIYQAPAISQMMALRALEGGKKYVSGLAKTYEEAAKYVVENLQAKFAAPQAGYYVFINFSDSAEGEDSLPIIERILDEGISLAPAATFGADFKKFARLCYSSVPFDELKKAIDKINSIIS